MTQIGGGEEKPVKRCTEKGTAAAKSLQSCLALCDPTDGSPPGSAVPGTLFTKAGKICLISQSLLTYDLK